MPSLKRAIPLLDAFGTLQFVGYVYGRRGKKDGSIVRTSPVVGLVEDAAFTTRSGTYYTLEESDNDVISKVGSIRKTYNSLGLTKLRETMPLTAEEYRYLGVQWHAGKQLYEKR